ncbi:MAG: hypothetical protein ABI661_00630 [Gammaproteobacteria bacterium]
MRIPRAVAASLAATLLLAVPGLPAGASLLTVERAFELTPDQVTLPDRSPGGMTVRPCSTCPPVVLQVTPATTWFLKPGRHAPVGQEAVLVAYRAAANRPAATSQATLVYVYYEPRTRRVNRVVLDARASAVAR